MKDCPEPLARLDLLFEAARLAHEAISVFTAGSSCSEQMTRTRDDFFASRLASPWTTCAPLPPKLVGSPRNGTSNHSWRVRKQTGPCGPFVRNGNAWSPILSAFDYAQEIARDLRSRLTRGPKALAHAEATRAAAASS